MCINSHGDKPTGSDCLPWRLSFGKKEKRARKILAFLIIKRRSSWEEERD
jgi:hypothetical protein